MCRRGDAHQCKVERPQRSDASKPYSSKLIFLNIFCFYGLKMDISGRSAFRKTYIEWSSLKVASAGAIDKFSDTTFYECVNFCLAHLLVLEAASPMENHGDASWVVSTPRPSSGVAAFIGFASQAKPVRFESAGASALHKPSLFVLIEVTQGIGVCSTGVC